MAGMILTADIGTSSLKAAFIDFNGHLRAFSRAAYPREPHSVIPWEQAFIRLLENLSAQAPGALIEGICISGNGPTLAPVDRDGNTLPPLYWYDGRTVSPPGIVTLEGKEAPKPSSLFLPHAAWLKANAPELYSKIRFFVSSHEWLASRLGAETLTVLPSPSYEPYYWDEEQCRLFGVDKEKFPPFVGMGEIIGQVSPEAASFFGASSGNCLKSGIPIVAGAPDFISALIGTGTLRPGDVCDRAGSSEGVNICTAGRPSLAPVKGKGAEIRVLPHVREGFWNLSAVIPSSGSFFDWYRSITGQDGRAYEDLLAELIPDAPDPEIFRRLEFFPRDGDLSSLIDSGTHSPFPIPHSPLAFGRSVLCAIGFSVRSALVSLETQGFPVKEMRVSGGQGKNRRWNQLKADITGVSLLAGEISDGELAGDAVLAATACGAAADLETAAGAMIRFRETYTPMNSDFWGELYNTIG